MSKHVGSIDHCTHTCVYKVQRKHERLLHEVPDWPQCWADLQRAHPVWRPVLLELHQPRHLIIENSHLKLTVVISAAVDWFINEVVLGPGGMGSGFVDGVFSDDVQVREEYFHYHGGFTLSQGLGEEHPNAAPNMGLTSDQVSALQEATQLAYTKMIDTLVQHSGYNWQAFGDQDGVAGSVYQGSCAQDMQSLCTEANYNSPMLLDMSDGSDQVIAAFLVARGPYW